MQTLTKLLIATACCLATVFSSAGLIPPQLTFGDDYIIVPYTAAGGEERVNVTYTLDGSISNWEGTPLSGSLTLDLARNVQAGEYSNEIIIDLQFLDSTSWTIDAFGLNNPDPIDSLTWYVSSEGLINGNVQFYREEYPSQVVSGTLGFNEDGVLDFFADNTPRLCIECGLDLNINLRFLDFSTGSLMLNLGDSNTEIITGADFLDEFDPYNWDLTLAMRPVPVPGALLLMLSGLIGLAAVRKRP